MLVLKINNFFLCTIIERENILVLNCTFCFACGKDLNLYMLKINHTSRDEFLFFFFLYPKHIGTSWKNYRVFFFKLETLLSFIISWRSGTGLVIFTETPSNDKHVIFFSTKWLQYVAEYLLFVNMFTTDFKILFSIYTYTYM